MTAGHCNIRSTTIIEVKVEVSDKITGMTRLGWAGLLEELFERIRPRQAKALVAGLNSNQRQKGAYRFQGMLARNYATSTLDHHHHHHHHHGESSVDVASLTHCVSEVSSVGRQASSLHHASSWPFFYVCPPSSPRPSSTSFAFTLALRK
ncbi:hypothetical protein PoB_005483000 [Plakobranchus ocellatus]|uniref:Uncharacterized protein n=1 Tax=Plakobranchus ocellatus TaxID=259542 RepID=A0AAV4C9G7_9GAST|nr:hypothetical protein PoB_005483000 [Plakobranchus ocellatus]